MDYLILFLTFFGALGGIILTYQWVQKRFFYKKVYLDKLSKLATTTTIDYFIELLGSPVFTRNSKSKKHYTFVNRLFYVTVATDLTGQVLMFSVTTRDNDFNPVYSNGNGNVPHYKVTLGKTTFSELDLSNGIIHSGLGNRHAFYAEEYYLGNPGLYQTYIFSMNDAGLETVFSHNPENINLSVLNEGILESSDPRLKAFRAWMPINTFSVIAPGVSLSDTETSQWIGVDPDQVRLLPIN